MEVINVTPAAELRAQTPSPFVASQSGVAPAPTANEEAQLRALFVDASAKGMELTDSVQVPQGTKATEPIAQTPTVPVPDKFKTPEGTVDEEKLKASSKQLDGAIEEKTKSIDEIMQDYKAREKKLHELSQQKADLSKQLPPIPATTSQVNPNDPQMLALHQQILADMQRDPVNTSIMLNQALVKKELEPLMQRFQQEDEIRQDGLRRDSFQRLAESDPRVMQNQYYAAINQVLDEDPAMMRLKNPHKAAWNEVKERLRLGEPMVPAQPSMSSPQLGRGAPPSVSTFQGQTTPQSLAQQVNQINPYSEEGRLYEQKLREATANLWQ